MKTFKIITVNTQRFGNRELEGARKEAGRAPGSRVGPGKGSNFVCSSNFLLAGLCSAWPSGLKVWTTSYGASSLFLLPFPVIRPRWTEERSVRATFAFHPKAWLLLFSFASAPSAAFSLFSFPFLLLLLFLLLLSRILFAFISLYNIQL